MCLFVLGPRMRKRPLPSTSGSDGGWQSLESPRHSMQVYRKPLLGVASCLMPAHRPISRGSSRGPAQWEWGQEGHCPIDRGWGRSGQRKETQSAI